MSNLTENDFKKLFKEESFWKELLPEFSISPDIFEKNPTPFHCDNDVLQAAGKNLNDEGYYSLKSVFPKETTSALSNGIVKMTSFNIHPIFMMLYDPYWTAFQKMEPILTKTLGDSWQLLPDFWVWNVAKGKDNSGWTAHRDLRKKFQDENGHPTLLTLWISLTDATPLNSCIYMVPTHLDPLFPDNLDDPISFPYENVRALPAPAGTILCWNVNAVHWGSRSTKHAEQPRVSFAFYLQRGDMEPYYSPLISTKESMNFNKRLFLVCTNIIRYKKRNNFKQFILDFAEEIISQYK